MFFIFFLILFFLIIYFYDIIYYTFDINYDVIEIENVLSREECNELINLSIKNGLENSTVWNSDDSKTINYSHRISKQTWLSNNHPLIHKICMLSEKYTGFPMYKQELLQVVKYDIGGKFEDHYDAWAFGQINRSNGQRKCTFMIFLNDNYVGGTTEFPIIRKKIIPKVGKAIIFRNTDSNENIIYQSLHRGNIISHGSKWICTVWSH
jgi:prolyl 4-hydroxylase